MNPKDDSWEKAVREIPDGLNFRELCRARNEELEHYDGPAEWHADERIVHGTVRFFTRWLPTPSLRYEFKIAQPRTSLKSFALSLSAMENKHSLVVPFGKTTGKAQIVTTSASGDRSHGLVHGAFTLNDSKSVQFARFGLVNFVDYHGSPIKFLNKRKSTTLAGRIQLRGGGWDVIIDKRRDSTALLEEVKTNGGYVITNHCELRRADGASFNYEAMREVLSCLGQFLGFAAERWMHPSQVRAYAASKTPAIIEMNDGIIWPYSNNHGWFNHRNGKSLEELWPAFFAKWEDPYFREVLRTVLWWFVGAASAEGGTDAGLILAQCGLETIAWSYFVEANHVLSAEGFDSLSAADKLRLLVSAMKLDQQLIPQLHDLKQWTKKSVPKCNNAAWAMTEVRNRLVHPRKREQLQDGSHVIFDAYQLAMLYLELAILFICGYRGHYTNRLTAQYRGTVEKVPWATGVNKRE